MANGMSLAARMKSYEASYRQVLPARSYAVIRVDGRAFHSYTRGLKRPFDEKFAADMDAVAVALAEQVTGAAFAYVQSDEVSVLTTDFAKPGTRPWFGGVTSKIVSLTASIATATLIGRRPPASGEHPPLFDSRVFTLPTVEEVVAYFRWRQQDAATNAISMAAQAHFSHRQLQRVGTPGLIARLRDEAGIDVADYPAGFRFGRLITRHDYPATVTFVHGRTGVTHTVNVPRQRWVAAPAGPYDGPAPWLPPIPRPSEAYAD